MRVMPMTLHFSRLADYIEASPAIPTDKDRSEVRVYATMVTGAAFWSLLMTAFYIWTVQDSSLYRVTLLTGSSAVVAGAFVFAALVLLPHLISLLFFPKLLGHMLPRKMVAGAMVFAGLLWAYLATKANPLDLGYVPLTYWASCVGYMLVGGAFGYSLNSQQALQKLADENASQTR